MKCDSPFYVDTPNSGRVPVPCGRCPNCKKRIVSSWAFRLMKESERAEFSYFVTLTYDTNFVPITANGFMSLDKSDIQKFMKRLRKNTGMKFRYFCVGEYGSENNRPHYHMILFCFSDVDLEVITQAWGKGSIHVGQVEQASVRYTMKYIDKPGRIPMFDRDDRVPEFRVMSKRLGDNYVTSAVIEYHTADLGRLYVTIQDGIKVSMPRYYRDKIFDQEEKEAQMALISERVTAQENARSLKWLRENPGKTFEDYVLYCEELRRGRYKKFYNQQKVRK